MLRLKQHEHIWRITVLFLLLITFIGPWGYDRINVPAQYECSWPNFRLEGDFCGVPLSGMSVFVPGLLIAFDTFVRVVNGTSPNPIWARNLWSLFIILIPLPILITPLLILGGKRLSRRKIYMVVWGLACVGGIGFFILVSSLLGVLPIRLWGLWVYMALVVIALALEIVMQVNYRKPGFES